MKRYFFAALAFVGFLLMGLGKDDHKHIWVAPAADTIQIETPSTSFGLYQYGWCNGAELVCVKCYQRKTQRINLKAPYISLISSQDTFPSGQFRWVPIGNGWKIDSALK